MNLIINGEKRNIENVTTVTELLSSFNLQQKILVVEVNRTIIERVQFNATNLRDGDVIEIVHFVGGG